MKIFKEAWADMRRQPVLSGVSIVGMALALFLIMVVMMISQVKYMPFAPESGRDRMLHAASLSCEYSNGGECNGPNSEETARRLYGDLPCGAITTCYLVYPSDATVTADGENTYDAQYRGVDANFWRVFDFTFVDGKPFSQADYDAALQKAVISESVARRLFGTVEATGREFKFNFVPYEVCGVVKDVSTLATHAYAEVWPTFSSTFDRLAKWSPIHGMVSVTILAQSKSDYPAIREAIGKNYQVFDTELKDHNVTLIRRDRPYDSETDAYTIGANQDPDIEAEHRKQWTIYLILLIVPAINLTSMTDSRLRRRISEIGIKRAFGCRRSQVFASLFAENLIVTLIAGALALMATVTFGLLCTNWLFEQPYKLNPDHISVSLDMVLNWKIFLWGLLFCFVLNMLSTSLPALRASRANIVNSLNARK
ncbi:MAG: ABC transporter permease [Bacteroidales bacterium]|nr:ABC transporter permease [Bacteroidales bacterium]